jgi:MFS family permease
MSHVTLQGLVESRNEDGDSLAITWLFVALFIPQLVVGPFAGVLADRVDRRRVVVACYSGAAVTAAGLAVLTASSDAPPLWAVYALAFTLGTTFSFIGPSAGALVVNSVDPEHVTSAISMHAAIQNMTRVAGPILAAGIIAAERFEIGFAVFAIFTAIAAVMMSRVHVPARDIPSSNLGVFRGIAVGYHHARERRPALLAISCVAFTSMFGVAHTALIPSFTSEVLGEDSGRFGIIVAATGLGAIVGALTVGYLKSEPSMRRGGSAMVMYAVCLTGFALSETLLVAIAWQVILGFFYFVTMTTLQTLVQQVVLDEMRGRVMSLFGIAWGGLVWVGTLILGGAADSRGLDLGERTTLVAAATALLLFGGAVTIFGRSLPTGSDYTLENKIL